LRRSVFARSGRSQVAAVGRAIADLRRGLEAEVGAPPDPHAVSIPAPRSQATVRGVDRTPAHAPSDRPIVAASAKD
jgi:hypothetical protein